MKCTCNDLEVIGLNPGWVELGVSTASDIWNGHVNVKKIYFLFDRFEPMTSEHFMSLRCSSYCNHWILNLLQMNYHIALEVWYKTNKGSDIDWCTDTFGSSVTLCTSSLMDLTTVKPWPLDHNKTCHVCNIRVLTTEQSRTSKCQNQHQLIILKFLRLWF